MTYRYIMILSIDACLGTKYTLIQMTPLELIISYCIAIEYIIISVVLRKKPSGSYKHMCSKAVK